MLLENPGFDLCICTVNILWSNTPYWAYFWNPFLFIWGKNFYSGIDKR